MVPLAPPRTLVGLAGSVTTLAAMDADLPEYDADVTHHYRLPAASVRALTARLLGMTRAERAPDPRHAPGPGRRDRGRGAGPGGGGRRQPGCAEVLVSEHDILDGIAWSLA